MSLTKSNRRFFLVATLLLVLTLTIVVTVAATGTPPDTTADVIYSTGLLNPRHVATDSGGNLYVANTQAFNSGLGRVLYYPAGSTVSTLTYGSSCFSGAGVTASCLSDPRSVAVDSGGGVYIMDSTNNRVLFYTVGITTASRVYGQGGVFTTTTRNKGGISADSLSTNGGSSIYGAVALDSGGNLYVADTQNHRVLYYPSGSTTATRVYGQAGNFSANTSNNGGVSATSLSQPNGVALDSGGNLYVADYNNSRVLYYPAGIVTATIVYGQGGVFNTGTLNKGGISAATLNFPQDLKVNSTGDLYVADTDNSRVLFYPAGSTTATQVYGQLGSFSTNTGNNGGVSVNSLSGPRGVVADSSGNLYVGDTGNNRVLKYVKTSCAATSSGNWNSIATWDCARVPIAGDDVIIGSGNTVTLDTDTADLKNLTIAGTLTNNGVAHTLALTGNWTQSGTFTPGTLIGVTFKGSGTQSINSHVAFYNFTTNAGTTLDVGSTLLTINGTLTNTGMIRRSAPAQTLTNGTGVTFNDAVNKPTVIITQTSGTDMGSTSLLVTAHLTQTNAACGATTLNGSPVRRAFYITPTVTSGIAATVRLYYYDGAGGAGDEANGNTLSNLAIYHCDGTTWTRMTGGTTGTDATTGYKYMELTGVTSFSPFAIGGAHAPTAVTLSTFSADEARTDSRILLAIGLGFTAMSIGVVIRQRRNKRQ